MSVGGVCSCVKHFSLGFLRSHFSDINVINRYVLIGVSFLLLNGQYFEFFFIRSLHELEYPQVILVIFAKLLGFTRPACCNFTKKHCFSFKRKALSVKDFSGKAYLLCVTYSLQSFYQKKFYLEEALNFGSFSHRMFKTSKSLFRKKLFLEKALTQRKLFLMDALPGESFSGAPELSYSIGNTFSEYILFRWSLFPSLSSGYTFSGVFYPGESFQPSCTDSFVIFT